MWGLPDLAVAAIFTAAGGLIIKLVEKYLDLTTAKANSSEAQLSAANTRAREIELMKDNLIGVFQKQIDDLHKSIDELLDKNRKLYEENIQLKYDLSDVRFKLSRYEQLPLSPTQASPLGGAGGMEDD